MVSKEIVKKISACVVLILLTGVVVVPTLSGSSLMSMQQICALPNRQETGACKDEGYCFKQDFSMINLRDSDGYVNIDMQEADTVVTTPGMPALPIVTKTVEFPLGTSISDVKVTIGNVESIRVSKPVQPVSDRSWLGEKMQKSKAGLSADYGALDVFPTQWLEYKTGGGLNEEGKHVTFVTFRMYPVRYHPSANMIYTVDRIDVVIDYAEPQQSVVPAINERELLIITPSQFVGELERLAQHKINMGISSAVVELSTVYDEANGRDPQEQIKYFIKDWVEEAGVQYVLLVGSIDLLPMRTAAVEFWDYTGIPTDLYYADLYTGEAAFCSWDSNDNDKFSEFNWDVGAIDKVDLYPDVYLGRLPCRTKNQVQTLVDKIVTYETTTYGSEWFNRIVVMGGDTFPGWGVLEGEVTTNQVVEQMASFNAVKLWTSENSFNPVAINQALSNGAGFVSYSGHGYEYGFGTSPPNEENRINYYTPYLLGVFNGDKLPIVFFDACLTTKLDFNVAGIKLPCLAWYLLRKPNGGAIATIGATRVAYTNVNHSGVHAGAGYLNVHFFKAYQPGVSVSQMFTQAQNDYIENVWEDCMTLEEFNLLGDPSLKVGGYPN